VRLTAAALTYRRVTATALVAAFLAGVMSYLTLPQAEDPGFIMRTAVVTTTFPGASPARVEELVTAKIEEAAQELPELDTVNSISATGISIVTVDIRDEFTDLRPIWDELRRRIEDRKGELPPDAGEPEVDDRVADVFGVLIGVTAPEFTQAEHNDMADAIKDRFLLLGEAARVEMFGDQTRQVHVTYSTTQLAELGLSPAYLQQVLDSQNVISPGGSITVGPESISLEPTGSFTSVEDIRRIPLALPEGGSVIQLSDVATVEERPPDPPEPMARVNGEEAVLVGVSLRDGGNINLLGKQAMEAVRDLEETYPIGVDFHVVNFQPDDVKKKIDDFMSNLLQSVAIVFVVMMLFLGFRTGMIVASLIPGAMLLTFATMSQMEVGIDQMSLAALLIALGMLVDNAIVVSENFTVRMQAGESKIDAAINSCSELWAPLLVSSLTTAAAFLPIYLGEGGASEFTASIFLVVTATLLASWLLAMTMIPLLSVLFMKPPQEAEEQRFDGILYRGYRALVVPMVRHPWVTLIASTALLFVSFYGFRYIATKFFPPSDRASLTMKLELAPGSDIRETQRVMAQIDDWLTAEVKVDPDSGEEGVIKWATAVGDGLPRFILTYPGADRLSHMGSILLDVTSREYVDEFIPELTRYVEENFPDATATAEPFSLGPPVDYPVSVKLKAARIPPLFDAVDATVAHLRAIPGVRVADHNWGRPTKKLTVDVDPARARRQGVTNADVARSMQAGLSGEVATIFRDEDESVPVLLRAQASDRQDLASLDSLQVFANEGTIPVSQVADLEMVWEYPQIKREDRLRTVEVYAWLNPGARTDLVNKALIEYLDSQDWGKAIAWEIGGEAKESAESNAELMGRIPIAFLAIVFLLVLQFDSFRRAAINLVVLPYAFIGVTFGLLITQSYFGFMTLLGIISLFGVVINNANVLIDRIDTELNEGRRPDEAIVMAGQRRMRPILLTTLTTVGGLIPLWLGGGPMFEPMAIVLIFGLVFGTVLTLGLVPTLYRVLFRVDTSELRADAESLQA